MNTTGHQTNYSIRRNQNNNFVYGTLIIDDNQKYIFTVVIYLILCGFVSFFGIITNAINMVIFFRQGLDSAANISFFAMAVSDLCCLLFQQVFNFYINPLCQNLHLPLVYTDFLYITGGVPRGMFARITCLITVYITAERCLCVVFPLHIKQMITTRTTGVIMFAICGYVFVGTTPLFITNQLDWQYNPEHNRTLLGIIMSHTNEHVHAVVYSIHAFVGVLSFLATVVFIAILITKLKQKRTWRRTVSAQQDKSASLSSRDRATLVTVVLVASILIVCYTPGILLSVTMVFVPEFMVGGIYYNMFYVMWALAFLLENINSSVNIFLYLKMSSNYREEFKYLFCRQKTAYRK